MNKKAKVIQQVVMHILFVALAIWFIIMGWWLALIIEAVVVILWFVGVAFVMVGLILKRKEPMITDDPSVIRVRDEYEDAVAWIETGEFWEQTSVDGLKLKGRFLKNEGSHVYALCCHGYKNHRLQDISNQAKRFYDKGYNVFAGHARGHGFSEGTYVGMACQERRDIIGWINRIVETDKDAKIFLYGVSMGGATVMTTSGEEDLPENVRVAIEDCGYKSIWAEFAYHMRFAYGLPAYPILNICEWIAKLRYGFGFHKYAAIEQVKKTKIPMLFIHGDQDNFVPYDMMEPLYEASRAPHKKKLTIPGAEHAEACRVEPEMYWCEVDAWLEKYL